MIVFGLRILSREVTLTLRSMMLRLKINAYCRELGHTGAVSGISGDNKVDVFELDREGCDSTTQDYPYDCTYWREENYESYPRISIDCYDNDSFYQVGSRKYLEQITLDGFYDRFTANINATLNGQNVYAWIEINGTKYYFHQYEDGEITFDSYWPINTKVSKGVDFVGDGTRTPYLLSELKIIPSVIADGPVNDDDDDDGFDFEWDDLGYKPLAAAITVAILIAGYLIIKL